MFLLPLSCHLQQTSFMSICRLLQDILSQQRIVFWPGAIWLSTIADCRLFPSLSHSCADPQLQTDSCCDGAGGEGRSASVLPVFTPCRAAVSVLSRGLVLLRHPRHHPPPASPLSLLPLAGGQCGGQGPRHGHHQARGGRGDTLHGGARRSRA